MRLRFTKMQGAGNDFVVLDATRQPSVLALTSEQARRLADRHFGVGADQILIVTPPPSAAVDFGYRILNASGDEVEHCGNGARCFVRYVHGRGLTDKTTVRVQTVNRVLELRLQADGCVQVAMGQPDFDPASLPFDTAGLPRAREGAIDLWQLPGLEADGVPLGFGMVSMGNPHAVLRVPDADAAPVATLGPRITAHPRFVRQVNAGFMQVLAPEAIRLRVHERGAGETLACGTGACAAVAAGIRAGWLARRVAVQMRGGTLVVEWPADDTSLLMSGPAEFVFDGEIEI